MARQELTLEQGKYSVVLGTLGLARFNRHREEGVFAKELQRLYAEVKSIHSGGRGDDRLEVKDAPSEAQKLARSVALIFEASQIRSNQGAWELNTLPTGLLPTQRFGEQQGVYKGFTGFLVGDDLLLTTAHGIVAYEELRVVFDYQLDRRGRLKKRFSDDEVFKVSKVQEQYGRQTDWLLLRLHTKPNRPYCVIDGDTAPLGTPLWMLGHPLGLPMKFVDGAKITNAGDETFETDLDASDGNSGAIVVRANSQLAIGVVKEASAALKPVDLKKPYGPKVWVWCRKGENCSTSVTSSAAFAPTVTAELARNRSAAEAREPGPARQRASEPPSARRSRAHARGHRSSVRPRRHGKGSSPRVQRTRDRDGSSH